MQWNVQLQFEWPRVESHCTQKNRRFGLVWVINKFPLTNIRFYKVSLYYLKCFYIIIYINYFTNNNSCLIIYFNCCLIKQKKVQGEDHTGKWKIRAFSEGEVENYYRFLKPENGLPETPWVKLWIWICGKRFSNGLTQSLRI